MNYDQPNLESLVYFSTPTYCFLEGQCRVTDGSPVHFLLDICILISTAAKPPRTKTGWVHLKSTLQIHLDICFLVWQLLFFPGFKFMCPQHFHFTTTSSSFTMRPVTHVSLNKLVFPFPLAHSFTCLFSTGSEPGRVPGAVLDIEVSKTTTKNMFFIQLGRRRLGHYILLQQTYL